ncbi:relaxase domain-containing protein [Streptomyces sp. NPDC058674]|uniref:relaxase domain-containing protein n=1 Tax=Streptomyces sp. NPDC058674 TaxID=3346592 RepID=UPI0036687557
MGLQWGNLSADSMLANIVAADTLYTLLFMEEVSARLGWAWEPREVTPGRRPVMEIAGIDQRLIGWQSTRRQQIEDALPVLTAEYEERQGHPPGERAAYALACQAADQTRSPKRKELRSLSQLRAAWRDSESRGVRSRRRRRAGGALPSSGCGDMGAGAPGRRRRAGGRQRRRRGVRDARRLQAPPPPRRSPPSPLLRLARPTSPVRPGRGDSPGGHRQLHPPGQPADDDRRPARPVPARHRGPGRAARADPEAGRRPIRAGLSRRRGADRPRPRTTPRGSPELPAPAAHRHRADH